MASDLTTTTATDHSAIKAAVMGGNLAKLNETEKLGYYRSVCESLGLNPLTQPFSFLTLNGKEVLYANRACTEQLRQIHGVSVQRLEKQREGDLYIVTCYVVDKSGRTDASTGAVNVKGLSGEALANSYMKAETKSKRRATLSICGLGILDESEVDSIPGAKTAQAVVENNDKATISREQAAELATLLKEHAIPWAWFAAHERIEKAGQLTVERFNEVNAKILDLEDQFNAENQPQEIPVEPAA